MASLFSSCRQQTLYCVNYKLSFVCFGRREKWLFNEVSSIKRSIGGEILRLAGGWWLVAGGSRAVINHRTQTLHQHSLQPSLSTRSTAPCVEPQSCLQKILSINHHLNPSRWSECYLLWPRESVPADNWIYCLLTDLENNFHSALNAHIWRRWARPGVRMGELQHTTGHSSTEELQHVNTAECRWLPAAAAVKRLRCSSATTIKTAFHHF